MRYVLFLVLILLTGCGYHLPVKDDCSSLGDAALMVSLFVNKTAKPFLEDYVTNTVVDELAAGEHTTVLAADAQLRLEGEITRYQTAAVSYNQNDEITEYRVKLSISARLVRVVDGKYLWRGELERSAEYPAAADRTLQQDNEGRAIQDVATRLAEDLRTELCLAGAD